MDFEAWIVDHTRYLKVHGYAALSSHFALYWKGTQPR
jgi:hypothetical protein